MEKLFKRINPEDVSENMFRLIGKEWMLITAGKPLAYNMMTASWGAAGVLWRKPVVIIFVRPQRHTYEFLENHPMFTVSFFPEDRKEILNLCGTTSGRDLDKMNIDGLTPLETPSGAVGFEEAKMTLECRKIYYDDINPDFFQVFELETIYPSKDYHRFYIGQIMQVWEKKTD
ncbi:MAG: flavin reductase [Bacteroidales bacterium]|nr:flavin reductase [Bacteroidales bacterium]